VIADLVGKGGHVRTVPIPGWVKMRSMPGQMLSTLRTVRSSAPSTRPGAYGATTCLRRCSGMWSGQRQGALASRSSHDLRRTCARLCHLAGGELDQIRFLLGHVSIQTTDANSDYDARSTTVSESSRTARELRARGGRKTSALGNQSLSIADPARTNIHRNSSMT